MPERRFKPKPRLNISRLKDPGTERALAADTEERFANRAVADS